jgi:hypothetical protein
LTLIAIAGKNRRLLRACERWAGRHQSRWLAVRVHGFVKNMPQMMGVADVVVTKPGGMSRRGGHQAGGHDPFRGAGSWTAPGPSSGQGRTGGDQPALGGRLRGGGSQ